MTNTQKAAAQKEAFSLAGMFDGFTVNLSKPDIRPSSGDGISISIHLGNDGRILECWWDGISHPVREVGEDFITVTTRGKKLTISKMASGIFGEVSTRTREEGFSDITTRGGELPRQNQVSGLTGGIYRTVRTRTRGHEGFLVVTTRDRTVSVSQRFDNSGHRLVGWSFATSTHKAGIEFLESIKKGYTEFRDKYARTDYPEFLESIKKGSTLNATPLITADSYQPFGSMPRLSSSRLNKRFIQPERLSSPSSCMAIDSRSYSSASKRSWTANRSFLLSLVDILNHHHVSFLQVDNVYQRQQKQNPVSADTPTGLLTTTVILSNEEAVLNNITHPQGRNAHTLNNGELPASFIWLIAAVRRDCQQFTVKIHHIDAKSEHEARQTLSREHVTFFAGRIRKGVAA